MSALLQPRILLGHLLALILFAAACGLGVWQLNAWSATRAAEARDLTNREPIALDEAIGTDDPFPGDRVGQPVTFAGRWLPQTTIFISGREHDGQEGYWVVTSVLAESGSAIPVVRGWVANAGTDTGDGASLANPTCETTLTGWLQPPQGTGQMDDDPDDDVLPQLRMGDLVQYVDADLYGAYVVLDADAPGTTNAEPNNPGADQLVPATLEQQPDANTSTGLRNFLYALEWWVFAAFVAFIWWRWCRDVIEEAAQRAQASTPETENMEILNP